MEYTCPFDFLGFCSSVDDIFTCLFTLTTYISQRIFHFIGEFFTLVTCMHGVVVVALSLLHQCLEDCRMSYFSTEFCDSIKL